MVWLIVSPTSTIHLVSTTFIECFYNVDTTYPNEGGTNNLNVGDAQPDAEHCRTFCLTTYPSAEYYDYTSARYTNNPNKCWCKKADMGTVASPGVISGNVKCAPAEGKSH